MLTTDLVPTPVVPANYVTVIGSMFGPELYCLLLTARCPRTVHELAACLRLYSFDSVSRALIKLTKRGLISQVGPHWQPTAQGRAVLTEALFM